MKNLFKKYFNSVLHPDEFSEIAGFFGNKKNEPEIFGYMKPFWEDQVEKNTDISQPSNPALLEQIKNAVLLDKQKKAQRKIKIYSWGIRVAAVLVVALLISNLIIYKKSGQNELADSLQKVFTPLGAKSQITLPDGSLVWLNSGSTLSYPLNFKKNRPVHLFGEAYFEVEKNDKPFIVSTDYGDVEVKGTSFNVKAYDDNSFETTLEEGVVAFKPKKSTNEVTLKPGEQVLNSSKGFLVREVETKYFTSWREGKLLFNREPFPDFIKKLERWYNVNIEYSNPELDKLWYTGTIEMESISEVMQMISKAAPVSYHYNKDTRVFTINTK